MEISAGQSISIICPDCGTTFEASSVQTYCHSCNSPLFVKYDLHVSDDQIIQAQNEVAYSEGILCAPEGDATWAAVKSLVQTGWIYKEEKIGLFITGSG
jgi:threonine synthase